ncbi:hypothetical protein DAPPUDRAFT_270875 [Daphnia pulex]|uniref:Uncharacterized protein n=1 Tax=Daphnia pulex TaxID=6669 RepID=E9I1E7_DAPPU|nr:hypothetical protein DAPPUDRAFT_270875 [Daphnia pulex]|eukprot:EFX62184.1 hypothetical protein DAPPUDRAFT_270875 [Daphnia pulex]
MFVLLTGEILMEERRERDETMSRENRRVAAISWSWTGSAGNGENLPPPKPSRVPAAYVGIGGSAGKSVTSASSDAIAFWTKDVPSGAQQRIFPVTLKGFVPVLAAQCGVMLQPMLYIRI